MELEDAIFLLNEKLRSKSFRKAVGIRVVEAIETLVKAFQCGSCISEREAKEMLNNYYIFESRLRRLIELYDKISRGSLRAVIREVLGEDLPAEPLEYDLLMRELELYRKYVFSIAERVLRCHSSTSSKA
ncbi:conserved hypothetical protein [Pyrobaculum islandicum DSM 4184]|uniref:Uncharacterized protein n=1 Tax=Pyrobaculum islandicum (strain DSM 4184 / JCM 9189 / GEO3) TaxID=384616 RepID=A1RT14_PYRIL|nr:hypothetical protein [Pyrobaculum islandicum]ABL88096.1 conserved hypothetical protein [Pyrobaculum islandicum DSM 4184]